MTQKRPALSLLPLPFLFRGIVGSLGGRGGGRGLPVNGYVQQMSCKQPEE